MHVAVLKNEIIKYLDPKPNENFIDCTIGSGGHSLEILRKTMPRGKILGIDWDTEIIRCLKIKSKKSKIKNRLILVNDSYANLKKIVEKKKFKNISGILFDLGMSTWHLKESGRGFSFQKDEPLDMRYSKQQTMNGEQLTAVKLINTWPPEEIEKILKDYGEEKFAKRISQEIIKTRKQSPIITTLRLVEVIRKATPKWYHQKKINPATKTFQALRIAVNNELENIKKVLPQALEILKPDGRIVIISFHSLEDRIVKNFLKEKYIGEEIKLLTKKPIRPSWQEIKQNPSARSARLRAVIKIYDKA